MTPYIIAFAAVFSLASYGLYRRTVWAWWGGWWVFFLVAGHFGLFNFPAIYYADTPSETLFALGRTIGGAVFWVPAAVWWGSRRSYFNGKRAAPPKGITDNSRIS